MFRAAPDGGAPETETTEPRRASGGTFDEADSTASNGPPVASSGGTDASQKSMEQTRKEFASSVIDRPKKEESRAAQYMRELISRQVKSNQLSRAGSLADSAVLRRKGRLKEQDPFIEFIVDLFKTHETEEALAKTERWVIDALSAPPSKRRFSNIYRQVPKLGFIFHPLPLSKALAEYDEFCALTKRRYVRPNFAEVRHIINIAQVHASAKDVKLVTFDADGTLYADGKHFEEDNQMIDKIQQLMEIGVHVAIVTAAGYPDDAKRFENRLRGLLDAFEANAITEEVRKRFHVMGGECNYLLEVNERFELEFIDWKRWRDKDPETRSLYWYAQPENKVKVETFLDRAQTFLTDEAEHLELDVDVMRKEYAVGVLPRTGTVYENLEELSIGAMIELSDAEVPYCAFNGGNDVFVDVGNKNIGLTTLMNYLGYSGSQTLHVGDRFTSTGNDSRVRDACSILWVASPDETTFFMRLLYRDIVNVRVL
jgi:IMP and pyridine-specific 5'-nucleotidase